MKEVLPERRALLEGLTVGFNLLVQRTFIDSYCRGVNDVN